MSGVHVKRRVTKSGDPRYLVYFRRGGSDTKDEFAGSFVRECDAGTRRDLIREELAAGRDPRAVLGALRSSPREVLDPGDGWRWVAVVGPCVFGVRSKRARPVKSPSATVRGERGTTT